jgi:hypothetical protein
MKYRGDRGVRCTRFGALKTDGFTKLSVKRCAINLNIRHNPRHRIPKGALHVVVKVLNYALDFHSRHLCLLLLCVMSPNK